jgi:hypothetical protein
MRRVAADRDHEPFGLHDPGNHTVRRYNSPLQQAAPRGLPQP